MPYAYGMQGFPAVGSGLPGLPQRASAIGADPAGPPLTRVFIRPADGVQQNYVMPDWATYARVTALGRGGRGRGGTAGLPTTSSTAFGGGGAGLSGSNQEVVSAGLPINVNFDTDATRVSFLGYVLVAGNGGDATAAAGGIGGVGSGGAVNFSGGAGESGSNGRSGGGAAGRGGNGVAGGTAASYFGGDSGPGDAFTTGGGPGGAGSGISSTITPYPQGRVGMSTSSIGAVAIGQSTGPNIVPTSQDGGEGGGGSGGSPGTTMSNIPGAALVLIELW